MSFTPVEPGDDPVGRIDEYQAPVVVAAISKKTMEQLRVEDQRLFPAQVILEANWDLVRSEIKVMRLKMSAYVLAEKLAQDHYTKARLFPFPSSPWQFFKERHKHSWWLGWLVDRRPVHYVQHSMEVTVNVDRYLAYPQATILDPKFGRAIQHEVVGFEVKEPQRD